MKFRKKPVVIEAVQLTKKGLASMPEWLKPLVDHGIVQLAIAVEGHRVYISTLEGTMTAIPGDWIIRGVKGEVYPCKPDIFEATYEAVEESHD